MQLHQLFDVVEHAADVLRVRRAGAAARAPGRSAGRRPAPAARGGSPPPARCRTRRARCCAGRPSCAGARNSAMCGKSELRLEREAVVDDDGLDVEVEERRQRGVLERRGEDQLVDERVFRPAQPAHLAADALLVGGVPGADDQHLEVEPLAPRRRRAYDRRAGLGVGAPSSSAVGPRRCRRGGTCRRAPPWRAAAPARRSRRRRRRSSFSRSFCISSGPGIRAEASPAAPAARAAARASSASSRRRRVSPAVARPPTPAPRPWSRCQSSRRLSAAVKNASNRGVDAADLDFSWPCVTSFTSESCRSSFHEQDEDHAPDREQRVAHGVRDGVAERGHLALSDVADQPERRRRRARTGDDARA